MAHLGSYKIPIGSHISVSVRFNISIPRCYISLMGACPRIINEQSIFFLGNYHNRPFSKMLFNRLYGKNLAFLQHPIPGTFDWILMLVRNLFEPSGWIAYGQLVRSFTSIGTDFPKPS